MNFKHERRVGRLASSVELTPLIDVVFLLLIFFMVSTSFADSSDSADGGAPAAQLGVELAAGGDEAETADGEPRIAVTIRASGEIAVDGQPAAGDGSEALAAALAAAPDARVVIAADGAARHDAVVRVLGAAARAGGRDVRILTRRGDAALQDAAPQDRRESRGGGSDGGH